MWRHKETGVWRGWGRRRGVPVVILLERVRSGWQFVTLKRFSSLAFEKCYNVIDFL